MYHKNLVKIDNIHVLYKIIDFLMLLLYAIQLI